MKEESRNYFKNNNIFYISEKNAPLTSKIFDSHYSYTINTIIQAIIDESEDVFKYLGNKDEILYAKAIIIPALIKDRIVYVNNGKLKCDNKMIHVHFGNNKYHTSKFTAQAALSIANKCIMRDDPNNIINGFEHVQKRSKKYIEERKQIIRQALNEIMNAPYAETDEDQCVADYSFILRIDSA